jgi:hypothetical protein
MAQDVSMFSIVKGIESINNLFTMMEGDMTHSQLFEGLKCESQIEDIGIIRSWGTFLGS